MTKPTSILIVDDQPNNLELLFNYLQADNANYRILKAPNGEVACKVAREKIPDLVIMDWEMPVLSGLEAVVKLKSQPETENIPVIMATGVMTSPEHLRDALEAGAIDYVRKPIDKIELLARVNSALKLSGAYQQILNQKNEIEAAYSTLKQTQTRLVQSEKMASLIQLTGGIVHEINNPITFITAGRDILDESLPPVMELLNKYSELDSSKPEDFDAIFSQIQAIKKRVQFELFGNEISESIKAIKEGTSRTIEIINKLQSFSRINEDLKASNLHLGIDATISLLKHQIRKEIELVRDYDESMPLIECHAGLLNQVFMNVLQNAVQAIEGKGHITINTEYDPAKKQATLLFKDTGKGISSQILDKVFDPFFTTHEVGEGTGLGLSISHSIIGKHRGEITIESQEGKGTSVRICIPERQQYRTQPTHTTN